VISGRYLSRSVLRVHRPSARLYILAQFTLARPGFADDIAFEGSNQRGNSTEPVAVVSPIVILDVMFRDFGTSEL
jgi:hypothetical protein